VSRYSWSNAPPDIRRQVNNLVDAFQKILPTNLTGIYLHGSLAMGCFNPRHSDLDLLAVAKHALSVHAKRRLISLLLELSGRPAPIEISVLSRRDLSPWRHPTPFDLHFSEQWRDRYQGDLTSEDWRLWNKTGGADADLAAHITILRERGIVLFGSPIDETFPAVPREDYLASILADYRDAGEKILTNPTYAVLTMARVYRFLADGTIVSKDEAGEWALTVLTEEAQPALRAALALYRGEPNGHTTSPHDLTIYATAVQVQVSTYLQNTLPT
jgi:Domain of unknown function (DUF4111)